jgi:heparin/heparan-sulfate lyase
MKFSLIKYFLVLLSLGLAFQCSFGQHSEEYKKEIPLSKFKINRRVVNDTFKGKKGFSVNENTIRDNLDAVVADIEISLNVPNPGLFVLEAETEPVNLARLKNEDQSGKLTLKAKLKNGNDRPTYRILYDVYRGGLQELGKFEVKSKQQVLKIWLPRNLVLKRLFIKPYEAPKAPLEAERYIPKIVPPSGHPRLWVNKESLPVVKSRLLDSAHAKAWASVEAKAKSKVNIVFDAQQEIFYNEELEKAIEAKAFYFLMTNDKVVGQEAVDLALGYLSVLEFGNVTYGDITREVGRAIYTGSLVYDWCYPLINVQSRNQLRKDLMRLARDMEIGWPPFYGLESIVNGHGNESQVCRDLLSMSIAIYDEDPEPYKYTSYSVLEQLVPLRKFEYQSPRHNQGIDYGGYRFAWEMHAAWLYYRMLGYPVFDDNIKNLPNYWLYMRTPDGKMLRDGDMFNVKYNSSDTFYWKNPQTMLLCYAYSGSGLIKGEFVKQGGLEDNPILFLLLDDPALKPDFDLNQLPLTKDFGPVLNSMIARTGWEEDKTSGNVVVEMKGGGYHFGNHQHADAGALQIYHRGIQVGDLGLYLSYGSPYDFNFNKRSVAHSMVLVKDPKEPLLFRTKTNDGGTRFSQRFPKTVKELMTDSWFQTGFVRSSATGTDVLQPSFSYFNFDITAAYSEKIEGYTKSMLFLNLKRTDVPAVMIVLDRIVSHHADMKKYWQINTLRKPDYKDGKFILKSGFAGKEAVTYVNMLKPGVADRSYEMLSGDSSTIVFDDVYTVKSPWPEAKGTRIMISPKTENKVSEFAAIFQMTEKGATELPVEVKEEKDYFSLNVADKIIIMAKSNVFLFDEIKINVPKEGNYEVICVGLQTGFWNIKELKSGIGQNKNVLKDNNTIVFESKGGSYILTPQRSY